MQDFRNNTIGGQKAQGINGATTTNESEVTELVKRATGGDSEAFGELYSIYLDRIYRYVFYQVNDRMMAEDITEEAFVKAWKAIDSCKGKESTFSAWLYRIAHNHLVDTRRSRQRQRQTEMQSPIEVRDPQVEAERNLERQELLETISCLPNNQRQVITLKFLEGMDNREIAEITGKSQGAIRVLQMRALAKLRSRLSTKRPRYEW